MISTCRPPHVVICDDTAQITIGLAGVCKVMPTQIKLSEGRCVQYETVCDDDHFDYALAYCGGGNPSAPRYRSYSREIPKASVTYPALSVEGGMVMFYLDQSIKILNYGFLDIELLIPGCSPIHLTGEYVCGVTDIVSVTTENNVACLESDCGE